jgi:hypothetical protein
MILGAHEEPLKERLRAQTTRTKTPVVAIYLRVPMKSVTPYQKKYISAESWRMKTNKRPYFIVTLNIFFAFIFTFKLELELIQT